MKTNAVYAMLSAFKIFPADLFPRMLISLKKPEPRRMVRCDEGWFAGYQHEMGLLQHSCLGREH